MSENTLAGRRDVVDRKKIFLYLLAFEISLMLVYLIGDRFLYNNVFYYALIAGIIVTPLFLFMTPVEPTIGLIIMIIATGIDFLGRIAKAKGEFNVNLTYFHLALFVTMLSTFLNMILRKRTVVRSVNLWPPFIVFILVLAMSLIYTPNFNDGIVMFIRIVVMGLIALIVIESVDKIWKVKVILWSLILLPMLVSVLTLYQLLTQGAIYSPNVVKMATSLGLAVYRSTGTFDNPNKLACFLMVGIILAIGMLFSKKLTFFTKSLLFFSIAVTCIGELSSFSRTGWLSILVALFIIVTMHKKWWFYWVFAGVVLLIMALLTIYVPQIWELIIDRFASIFSPSGDESSSSRISLIKSGIWMWQDHPIFGVGLRGFPKLYYNYIDPNIPHILVEVNEAHTIQFEILAEEGIIGFVVASWLFFTVLFHGFKTSFTIKNQYLRNVQISFAALFVAYFVNFTFATDIVNNLFWISVGILYAIPHIDRELSEEAEALETADSAAG